MKSTTIYLVSLLAMAVLGFTSCKKEEEKGPRLIFKFKFDSTQARLNNIGQPASLPANHRAQSPKFNRMSAHYIELAGDFDQVGGGKVLYKADETTAGGSTAIDFSKSTIVKEGEEFFSIPLKDLAAGSYKWLRVSLAYQNYDIKYKQGSFYGTGTVASFIGYNTYVTNYTIKNVNMTPSQAAGGPGNHLQGYWGFETSVFGTNYTIDGQAPQGATTVPNPNPNSPIPAGSCLVTGKFVNANGTEAPFTITGNETNDIVITVSLSTNNSFEWQEAGNDNYYEPAAGDQVVDMGIRGLVPYLPQ